MPDIDTPYIPVDIDDAWEDFLAHASCHFHPELEALAEDLELVPIDEDDVLPW